MGERAGLSTVGLAKVEEMWGPKAISFPVEFPTMPFVVINWMKSLIGKVLLMLLGTAFGGLAGDTTAPRAMALLKANCFSCHNPEKKKGGLRLTSREDALKGGDNGPAIVPGKADKSLAAQAVLPDADPHMPPKKQLSAEQINLLRQWIDAGAPWDAQALANLTVVTTLDKLGPLPADYQPVLAIALSSDGKRLAVGRGNRIDLYNVEKPERVLLGELGGHRDTVQALAWSPDGARLVSGSFRQILVWDTADRRQVAQLTNQLSGRVTALEFLPDNKTLVVADGEAAKNGLIHLWDLDAPKPEATFEAHTDTIFALQLSRDGKSLATAGADKMVKLWNLGDRKETARFEGHTGHILALAFNEDDTRLASAGTDREIKVWDVKTRDKVISLNQQTSPVTGLAWTPDGKKMVAVCEDGSARAFTDFKVHKGGESSEGASNRKMDGAGQMLYCVTTSPDGKMTFAGAHDGTVFAWEGNDNATRMAAPSVEKKPEKVAAKTASAKD
jgi:WD40 repeat protein